VVAGLVVFIEIFQEKMLFLETFFFPSNCELAGGVAAKGAQAFKKTSETKAITCWSTVHRRIAFVCV
jgi:hypothetical protein